MTNDWLADAAQALQAQRRRSAWQKVVCALAAAVVFCTVYALILPAITLEREPACGLEEHTHTDACYEEQTTLGCGLEESEIHTHADACYVTLRTLLCTLPEHTHTDACYPAVAPADGADGETATPTPTPAGSEDGETATPTPTPAGDEDGEAVTADLDGGTLYSFAANAEDTSEELELYLGQVYTKEVTGTLSGVFNSDSVDVVVKQEENQLVRGSDASYTGTRTALQGAEYQFTAVEGKENTYTISSTTADGENVYLNIAAPLYPSSTATANITIAKGQDDGFYLSASSSGYLYFHRDNDPHFNRNSKTDGVEEQCTFLLYKKEDTSQSGGPLGLPGYTQVKELTDVGEGSYLIVAQVGSTYYLLYPSADSGNTYSHAARLAPYTMEITAKKTGEATVAVGDVSCHVVVKDTIELKAMDSVQIQLPAGAAVAAADTAVLSASADTATNLVTLTGIAPGTATVTVTVGGETYTWKVTVNQRTGFTLNYNGNKVLFEVKDAQGNPLAMDQKDINAEDGKWYFFGSEASDPYTNYIPIPEIPGYEFVQLTYKGYQVASVRIEGENIRFYEENQTSYYTWSSEDPTASLIYRKKLETVPGANHGGTTVDLFDYWVEERGSSDNQDIDSIGTAGINYDHGLLFKSSNGNSAGIEQSFVANTWTGNENVCQGIVKRKLENGYPVLSGERGLTKYNNQSLGYLFDPYESVVVDGKSYKQSYHNVKGLLQMENGYYTYDSTKNFAQFEEASNRFTLYNQPGVRLNSQESPGQFFPFNRFEDVWDINDTYNSKFNHYFGMAMTTMFITKNGGKVSSAENASATTFEFSGDDDVWIFIDDVLVADLGGIHNAASVKIDFSTGQVIINEDSDDSIKKVSTLKQLFEDAQVGWTHQRDTFDDESVHTLKFFYLERGNNESNLKLHFNLVEIPATSIYKVNQYGDPVPGATFAVYMQNQDGDYKTGEGEYIAWPSNARIETAEDENKGKVTFTSTDGNTGTISPCYVGTTDSDGAMIFQEDSGMPMSISEIKDRFGEYFALREIVVPEGYRYVSQEIPLHVQSGMLQCKSPYKTGVWAAPNLLVTAQNTLYLYQSGEANTYRKQEYLKDDGTINGTMFAVVFKYKGESSIEELRRQENWDPVYGDDIGGYTVLGGEDGNSDLMQRAIQAAQMQEKTGHNTTFYRSADGDTMQLELDCLPGNIETYYYMLDENKKQNAQYTVAYYWTSASSLSGATEENTHRVNGDAITNGSLVGEDGTISNYNGFTRVFGATIQVPNLKNRLYAQKLNEEGVKVNGATFALYQVEELKEQKDGETVSTIYYLASGNGDNTEDGSKTYVCLGPDVSNTDSNEIADNQGSATVKDQNGEYTYSIQENGVINILNESGAVVYTIFPATNASGAYLMDTTKDKSTSGEGGTADFDNLPQGSYYLREIKAPPNYQINPTETMVLVTGDAIYANAGTIDNGVQVERGPGYVVSTMHQVASDGDIDKTLTWIYEKLRVETNKNNTFDWLGSPATIPYASDENGNPESEGSEGTPAMVSYLKYTPSSGETGQDVLYNYTLNKTRDADLADVDDREMTQPGRETRRLATNVGWGYLEIFQDSDYAKAADALGGASYTTLLGDIATLFSRSAFVKVTDPYKYAEVTVEKKDAKSSTPLAGVQFALYRESRGSDQGESKAEDQPEETEQGRLYYSYDEKKQEVMWTAAQQPGGALSKTQVLTTNAQGEIPLKGLEAGTYTLQEIKPLDGYQALAGDITFTIYDGEIGSCFFAGKEIAEGDCVELGEDKLTLTVTNSAGYELPETGGSGTMPYRAAGTAITLAAALCGLRIHRKRRKGKGGAAS